MEPLNRFETDFINTCDQGLQMIADVGSPALKLHLDTFHMNIEEKNQAKAIRKAGKLLGHFHACGSDRGTPGNDHIDWKPDRRRAQGDPLQRRRGDRIVHDGRQGHREGSSHLAADRAHAGRDCSQRDQIPEEELAASDREFGSNGAGWKIV